MRSRKTDKWRLIEKRGSGIGKDYKPWLKIHEFGSRGRTSRPLGWKTKRVHQLMSDLEYYTFLNLQFDPDVLDIREQYPLLPLEQTKLIAKELGVAHPPKTRKEKTVMTTDFLITLKNHDNVIPPLPKYMAIAVKPKKELDNLRTREKLCIEEHYWAMKNIPFKVVTEEDINRVQAKNLEVMYQCYWWAEEKGYLQEDINSMLTKFKEHYRREHGDLLNSINKMEKEFNWDRGEGINFLFCLITHREVKVDLSKKIDITTLQIKL